MTEKQPEPKTRPGVCIPWEDRKKEYPRILGDEQVVKKVWEEMDDLAYQFIWACLIQF